MIGVTKKDLLSEIKRWYNGYSWDGKEFVYNPFSTLLFFDKKRFSNYWFASGTPTFLIEQIRKRDDLEIFTKAKIVGENSLSGLEYANIGNIGLLFQTGYLTIKKEEATEIGIQYELDFPNMEVRNA
ncbi:MAG: AAA family ATPase, partial [Endomicrobium sp.]|nr:AAA family ATPase [Endomicrobium sp.]